MTMLYYYIFSYGKNDFPYKKNNESPAGQRFIPLSLLTITPAGFHLLCRRRSHDNFIDRTSD